MRWSVRQLGRELGLVETTEAETQLPHRERLAEQRHVLPSQPLNRVHDRSLAQPPLDDPRVRQKSEVPDVMAAVGQPPDDVGKYAGSTSVIGTMTGPSADLRTMSSTSYTPCRQAGKSWKSPLS